LTSLKKILLLCNIQEISNEIVDLIGKFCSNESDTQKINAINIIPCVYAVLKSTQKNQLVAYFLLIKVSRYLRKMSNINSVNVKKEISISLKVST